MHTRFIRMTGAAVAALAVGACADGVTSARSGPVRVTMQQTSPAAAAAAVAGEGTATLGKLSRDDITSLIVHVTAIEFLPAATPDDPDPPWEALAFDQPARIDLLALPTEGESPLVIASGGVADGNYRRVRLFLSDEAALVPTIVFSRDIVVGQSTFAAGDPGHPVTSPSAAQSGIKTDVTFTVEGGAEVHLLFDVGATFQNVTATGSGKVMLSPVIRARP